MWCLTHDTWHVTCDIWQMTCDIWKGELFHKNLNSPALMVWDRQYLEDSELKDEKKSSARVPIEGQCVLLQITLKIKIFNIFSTSQSYRMNHISPDMLLNHWKNCKNIRNYGAKEQKCPKMDKNLYNSWSRQKYSGVRFSITFLCFILELSKENLNKLGQTILKIGSQFFKQKFSILAKMYVEKKVLRKLWKISF